LHLSHRVAFSAAASADGDAKKKKKGGAADGDDVKEEVHVDATPKGEKKDMSRPMNEVRVVCFVFCLLVGHACLLVVV
jgi:hypothetical protein